MPLHISVPSLPIQLLIMLDNAADSSRRNVQSFDQ